MEGDSPLIRPRFPMLAALVLATAMTFAVACGSDDDDSAGQTPAANTPAATSAAKTPTTQAAAYPMTLTDMLGRSVTIDKEPAKVAALSPTTVEYVYAAGGTSVTRSTSVRFPAEAASATDVGSSYQPNFEIIAGQAPDLIIADSILQAQLKDQLEALKVPVLFAGAASYDDAPKGLRLVGVAIGNAEEGEAAAKELEDTKADVIAKLPATKPSVLVLNGTPDDFYVAKPESYVGDLLAILGVSNVAAGQPDSGRFPGYTKLSLETIVADGPDVVLGITAGPPGGTKITDSLSTNPAWQNVPAVQQKRVSEIDAVIFLQAPGPRAGDGLMTLAKLVYPDIFQ